jgi:hypothetical protein
MSTYVGACLVFSTGYLDWGFDFTDCFIGRVGFFRRLAGWGSGWGGMRELGRKFCTVSFYLPVISVVFLQVVSLMIVCVSGLLGL